MSHRRIAASVAVCSVVVGVLVFAAGASARHTDTNVNWVHWGNTADENRYSPLTQITPSNVNQLGRLFISDLNKFVPGIKKGQQSYPIVVNGVAYITSGDDQVFAINATAGDMLWRYVPDNVAVFKNFGIVANRGVAYCDNKLYLLTLDMTVVALDASTGKQIARVPIARAVPGAMTNYGYSETSAPICANHTVIVGAAGSDYGVRGFVMAYHEDLTPAWANPFWNIPPAGTEWRSAAPLVGGCTTWTPSTVDTTTNTLYFGTAASAPAYYPSLRPGSNPRCSSVVAVDLATGKLKWWQQQLASNQWAYDSIQPPLVYTAKVGGKSRRVVSIGTMEGVWFAYDAATGAPIYQRVKVIDNVEHPPLKPGQPVVVYPASIGGLNYSPASYDPQTNYVYNAAAETAVVMVQQTPAQEKQQQMLLGNTFLGLANGDFGSYLQSGWHDYGSVSAIDVATGTRVWKFNTPEPERGGVTTTAGGVGFVGGGDGNLRAFDVKTGAVLWKFQTGRQIAAGPSIYSVNGTEYVAITVGGTTTSSNGGTVASQLQVFALGANSTQSPAFTIAYKPTATPKRVLAVVHRPVAAKASGAARIATPAGLTVKAWDPNTSNTQDIQGHVLLDGKGVAGVKVSVNGWVAPATDTSGAFTYPVDITMAARHEVKIASVAGATVGGQPLTAGQQQALLATSGGVSVGYAVTDLKTRVGSGGTVVIDGRLTYGQQQGAGAGEPSQLPAQRDDHLRRRTTCEGCSRHHPDERPQVLDVLDAGRGERHVQRVPGRRGPGRRRPGADDGGRGDRPGCVRAAAQRVRQLRRVEELAARYPAARRSRRSARHVDTQTDRDRRRRLRRARRRGRWQGSADQAGERNLAGRERQVRDRLAELGPRSDGQVLGGAAPVLLGREDIGRWGCRPGNLSVVSAGRRPSGIRDGQAPELRSS